MVRPRKCRCINGAPRARLFKPQGVPFQNLKTIVLKSDETEALRLRDIEGLNQVEAAESMEVSQSTFQRILRSAQKKLSEAILEGKAIQIQE